MGIILLESSQAISRKHFTNYLPANAETPAQVTELVSGEVTNVHDKCMIEVQELCTEVFGIVLEVIATGLMTYFIQTDLAIMCGGAVRLGRSAC